MDILEEINEKNKKEIEARIEKCFVGFLGELEKIDKGLINDSYVCGKWKLEVTQITAGALVFLMNRYSRDGKEWVSKVRYGELINSYNDFVEMISRREVLSALENVLDHSKGKN
jgi:hypothetical protein